MLFLAKLQSLSLALAPLPVTMILLTEIICNGLVRAYKKCCAVPSPPNLQVSAKDASDVLQVLTMPCFASSLQMEFCVEKGAVRHGPETLSW